jgi:hypothetical protein
MLASMSSLGHADSSGSLCSQTAPNQYSAAKRMQKWNERAGHDEGQQNQLRVAAEAEKDVNESEQAMSIGNTVIFGAIFDPAHLSHGCGGAVIAGALFSFHQAIYTSCTAQ